MVPYLAPDYTFVYTVATVSNIVEIIDKDKDIFQTYLHMLRGYSSSFHLLRRRKPPQQF